MAEKSNRIYLLEEAGVASALLKLGNRHSPTVIVAAITSRVHTKAKLPTHTAVNDFADMEYEDKLSLLTTLIERIIIAPTSNEEICHIFIKGCSKDDYDDFFRESEDEMCDLGRHSKYYMVLTSVFCM